MGTDLERRRLAVAAALRRVMAEPLPPLQAPPVTAIPPVVVTPAPLLPPVAAAPPLAVVAPITVDAPAPVASREPAASPEPGAPPEPATPPVTDDTAPAVIDLVDEPTDWDSGVDELEDDAEGDGISVPPLEPIGSMSRAASRALFGD